MKLKGLQKRFCEDTTLYFGNKSREVRIYPKLQEVYAKGRSTRDAIDAARGNLRFEYCLLNPYGVTSHAERLGLPDSTVKSLITKNVSDAIFSKLFSEIDFPNLVTNDKSNLERLKEHYSTRKAIRLTGFLEMIREYGELFFKDRIHRFSKDSYYYAVRQCRKADAWNSRDCLNNNV